MILDLQPGLFILVSEFPMILREQICMSYSRVQMFNMDGFKGYCVIVLVHFGDVIDKRIIVFKWCVNVSRPLLAIQDCLTR